MVKEPTKYAVGDKVFAKVRGYPPWPAKIQNITDQNTKNAKFQVVFYGTGETGICKSQELSNYEELKDKIVDKYKKRKSFIDGVHELQRDLGLPVKDAKETKEAKETPVAVAKNSKGPAEKPKEVKATKEAAAAKETIEEPKIDEAVTESNDEELADSNSAGAANDSDADSQALVIDEEKKGTKRKAPAAPLSTPDAPEAKKKRGRKPLSTTVSENTPKQPEVRQEAVGDESPDRKEVVSRSGRVIKPKRFADFTATEDVDVLDKPDRGDHHHTPTTGSGRGRPTKQKLEEANENQNSTPTSAAQKKKTVLVEKKTPASNKVSVDSDDAKVPAEKPSNFLLATTFAGHFVGIKLDVDKPKTFESEEAKARWNWTTAKNAMKLKAQLEKGEVEPESVKHMLYLNITPKEIENSKEGISQPKKYKLKWLRRESQLLKLESEIKSHLGLERANTEDCLLAMESMMGLVIDPLMLKKHPLIVETVKRLKKYVGNLADWKLNEEETAEFQTKAEQIRNKAEQIYNKFETLFVVPDGQDFYQAFTDQVACFKDMHKELSDEKMFSMVADPTCPDVNYPMDILLDDTNNKVVDTLDTATKQKAAE